jgi:hypothetical protein
VETFDLFTGLGPHHDDLVSGLAEDPVGATGEAV